MNLLPRYRKANKAASHQSGPASINVEKDQISPHGRQHANRRVATASFVLGAVAGGCVGALLTVRSVASAAIMLKALTGFAWPLIAVLALWLFRGSVSNLIGRIRSGEVGPKGLSFTVGDIVAQAGRAVGEEGETPAQSGTDSATAETGLALLAATDPPTAINQAWRRVRNSVRDLTIRLGIAEGTHGTPQRVQLLINRGVVNPDLQATVQRLRSLYYDLKQQPNLTVSPEDAVNYVAAAQLIESELNSLHPRTRPVSDPER